LSAPTQIDRPFRVKTSLGDDALLLDSFVGVERVSDPFHFVLRLLGDCDRLILPVSRITNSQQKDTIPL